MKKIIYIIAAALLMVSCAEKGGTQQGGGEKLPTLKELICGEWHSKTLPTTGTELYISFAEDEYYTPEATWEYFRGIWNLEGTLLSGKYNDSEDWASSYNVAVKDATMTLVSNNDAAETSTFEECSIPEKGKDTPYIEVKGISAF